jgi:hypothetical protein
MLYDSNFPDFTLNVSVLATSFPVKLWDAIRRKYPGQLARGVLSHHDDARPHTAQATPERIQELQ